MAEVRASAGVPLLAAFGGIGAPTPCTPLILDTTNRDLYANLGEVVTKIASAGISSGNGVPAGAFGSNGDFYFRFDGAAGTFIYHKTAGVWGAFA
jgi:hypothetical protein